MSSQIAIADPTFTVAPAGIYHVTYVGNTALVTALGGVEVRVNNIAQGTDQSILAEGDTIVLDRLINVPAGGVVTINAVGALTLAATGEETGGRSQITIERIA